MKRFIFAAVATVVSFGILHSAEAGNRGGGNGNGGGGNRGFQTRSVQNVQNFQHNQNVQHNVQHVQNFQQVQHNQNFQKQQFHNNNQFRKQIVIASPRFDRSQLRFQNYHIQYGRKFDYGYCYYGRTHQHWVSTIFSTDCGCNTYYCPYTESWYYWCEPDSCYYPVTYCPYGTFVF